jgi:hypothetical protein
MESNRSGLFGRSCFIVLDESPVGYSQLLASDSPTATILDHNFPFVEQKSANGNRSQDSAVSRYWFSPRHRPILCRKL